MPALLEELDSRLTGSGLVGGATGWALFKSFLPADPDQVVVLYELPGSPPEAKVDIDRPGFQVRVRGAKMGYEAARAKAEAIYLDLHKFTGLLLGTYYVAILAAGHPALLGYDQNERPELVQTFNVTRSRG